MRSAITLSDSPTIAQPTRSGLFCWAVLIVIGISWGSTMLFSKIIVTAGHHPVGLAFTGTVLGAVLLTIILVATGRRLPVSRRHLVFYAICGLVGTALPNTLSYRAMNELSVGVMSIAISVVPIMTFVGALLMGIDRPEARRLFGLVCGTGAVLLLVVPDTSLPRPGDTIWLMLPLLTGLSYTVENLYLAKAQPRDCDALQTMCGLTWAALVLLAIPTFATGSAVGLIPFGTIEAAIVVMTVLHVASYGGFVWLVARAGPVFAAQVAYVVTMSGVFWGMALLGERHSLWVWAALVLMLIGLSLVQPRRAAKARI